MASGLLFRSTLGVFRRCAMRRAAVDQRGKDLILSSYSLTSAGFFIPNDTMRRATSDIDVDRSAHWSSRC
jgi:hypothetical protein